MRIGSLCAGYGGLTLATHAVCGGELAWYSEIDPAACRVLAARFPGVPNIGDMTTVDWADVEPVDVLDGGTPCQDLSHAGGRAGMRAGTRSGLWSAMVEAIDVLRPRRVVWENVRGAFSAGADSEMEPCPGCMGDRSGHVLRAFGRVLGDLADSGYDAGWCGLPASAVGAPHARYRAFVVAEDADQSASGQRRVAAPGPEESGRTRPDARGRDRASTTDSGEPRPQGAGREISDSSGQWPRADVGGMGSSAGAGRSAADSDRDPVWEQPVALAGGSGPAEPGLAVPAADSDSGRLGSVGRVGPVERDVDGRGGPDVVWGAYEPAIRRWEAVTGRPAPAPTTLSVRGGQRLSPVFVEWMMGLPAGWVTDVPGISRNDMLKMLGNGVVPQQAAAAIRHLTEVT